ncbi:MAG: stage V sporulation T C-terminal domain-containing protein [Blautia massiliensis (ex Durand et al. 2017)]
MYQVKRSAKGNIQEFDPDVYNRNASEEQQRKQFRQLIRREELRYYYQPIVSAVTGKIYALEALMHVELPTLKLPEDVVRLAKEEKCLHELERITFFRAAEGYVQLRECGDVRGDELLFIKSIASESISNDECREFNRKYGDLQLQLVLEIEIRKTLRIKEGTPLEIFTDREGQIILKKYSPIGELNTFAAEYAEALVQTTGLTACITDRDQVVAACGSGSRELEGKEISSDLDAVIAGRKGRMVSQDSRENISVISDAMDSFCQKMIQPILCASDAIGAVILLTKSEKTALGDTERALVRTAAGFLGRQMEQ